jgi:hypothetical protein
MQIAARDVRPSPPRWTKMPRAYQPKICKTRRGAITGGGVRLPCRAVGVRQGDLNRRLNRMLQCWQACAATAARSVRWHTSGTPVVAPGFPITPLTWGVSASRGFTNSSGNPRYRCPHGVQVRARFRPGSSEPEQPHIRSAHAAAAPQSRLRRAGLRKARPLLSTALEASSVIGSPAWIRQGLIRVLPNKNAVACLLRWPS